MNNTQHTPGPWEVVGSRICTVANDKERITLAKTEPGGAFAMSEQQDANAHLIAAAPTMYRELETVREYLLKLYDQGNSEAGQYAASIDTTLAQAKEVL